MDAIDSMSTEMPSKTSDKVGDREKVERREKRRHKSSRTSRREKPLLGDEDSALLERSSTVAGSSSKRRSSMPVPELQRRASSTSLNASKTSLPYPTFSKAHSREAVGGSKNGDTARPNVFTPDPTDLQQRKDYKQGTKPAEITKVAGVNGPPSPPLTAMDQPARVEDKRSNLEKIIEETKRKLTEGKEASKGNRIERSRSSSTRGSPWPSRKGTDLSTVSTVQRSKPGTPTRMKPKPVTIQDASSLADGTKHRSRSPSPSLKIETGTEFSSTIVSDTTSVAPKQHTIQQPFSPDTGQNSLPLTDIGSSPKTPTPRGTPFPSSGHATPAYIVPVYNGQMSMNGESPMPPPPPPPPEIPFQIPKVDYLMQNGGLPQSILKTFVFAPEPRNAPQSNGIELPDPTAMAAQVERFFTPYNNLLDDYTKAMAKNGSLAVATGYRSIARRLLDRLEVVFARDISSETCACDICQSSNIDGHEPEDDISWGVILEYVCGRRELPTWPAFVLHAEPAGLGLLERRTPMQKLDIDVPEEYRDHYIRQSKKTKQSVDAWLASQTVNPSDPPEDADDDTLTFAMLTHIQPIQRSVFKTLLGVAPSRPASRVLDARTPGPAETLSSELLDNTALAIQRLYQLAARPRRPESAIYLLNNPHLHNVLATLAAISDGEWEILTSGRFDGFLRSGAEDVYNGGVIDPPAQSRGTTPALRQVSRGPYSVPISFTPAPATVGAPVALDEETEIATLAEIEREIYLGMEALEDAFEQLHTKAESVRTQLRERGAGLSMASQARRGGILEARLGTPASGFGVVSRGWDSETDDGIEDGVSELAPDDSASNVSSSRHRRPKRRTERRTPALVEEEDEGEGEEGERDGMGEDGGAGGEGKRRMGFSRAGRRR